MMMALSLPRFISLGFEGKYLVCGENGVMQISGEDCLSPLAKIEVERSKCSEELVHLRSCYNNKYLRMLSENDDSIAAIAVEPEEDQSKWSCTLFRPRPLPLPLPLDDQTDSSTTISSNDSNISDTDFQFQIMAAAGPLNSEETGSTTTTTTTDSSFLKLTVRNTSEVSFTVTDTLAVVQLPQFVILKGDNGMYLKRHRPNLLNHRFVFHEEDSLDASVFQVLRMSDGSVRLNMINLAFGFLRFDEKSLTFTSGSTSVESNDLRTRFKPVKIGSSDTAVGLRLLLNNFFCKRYFVNGINCFGATSSELESAAVLEIEEAVCFRSVTEIVYQLKNAKIYDSAPVTSVTKDVKNESESTQEGELTFTYTETKSQNWGSMTSWGVGIKVSMKTKIPFIGKFGVELGAEFDREYEWGETNETETQVSTQLQLKVPKKTKTQVTMIVSRGTIQVPFAYTQRDTLFNGSLRVSQIDDGLFTAVNTYVSYKTTEQPL